MREGSNERGRKGMRMQEGIIPKEEYDFGELHGGIRYKRIKTRSRREEKHSEPKESEPCT
jgi:hypothetical protein